MASGTEIDDIALVALGKNWELPVPDDPRNLRLSIESRTTALAAGLLYIAGQGNRIIMSSGHTAGSQYPSEAEAMLECMRQRFGETDIPRNAIVLEEESRNTYENLKNVQAICEARGIGKVALISVGYHLPRVKRIAERLELPVVAAYKSDKVIFSKFHMVPRHYLAHAVFREARERRSLRPVMRTLSGYALEAAGWAMDLADPSGERIAGLLASRFRHQSNAS